MKKLVQGSECGKYNITVVYISQVCKGNNQKLYFTEANSCTVQCIISQNFQRSRTKTRKTYK